MSYFLEGSQENPDEPKGVVALDLDLIGAVQAVEHYEMVRYGTLNNRAAVLGLDDAADLCNQTPTEE